MSMSEGFQGQNQDGQDQAKASNATPALCAARDLTTILNRIADQIADADRRHSAVLDTMHDRLGDLVRGTMSAREQAAPGVVATEHGLAGSQFVMQPPQVPPLAESPSGPMGSDADSVTMEPVPVPAPAFAPAPAALRSAMGDAAGGSFTRKDEHGAEVDPFDVVGLEQSNGNDDPWDPVSAEALTRLYESEGLGQPTSDHADELTAAMPAVELPAPLPASAVAEPEVAAPASATVIAPAGLSLAAAAAAMASMPAATAREDVERAWLEEKFADIAAKLEQSLEALRPDGSLNLLEERFERLEARLGDVLADTATRSDLAGLKSIELQVEDLAHQLQSVQQQFSRLSDIETELRTIGETVSEERMSTLIAGAGAQSQVMPDEIAQKITAQVLSSMPRDTGRGDDNTRIEELRGLITAFIAEQRQGDEQTVTMLDTMQQAMIRLLDRMDALENGVGADTGYPAYEEQDARPAVVPEPRVEPHFADPAPVHPMREAEPVAAPVAAPVSAPARRMADVPVEVPTEPIAPEVKRPQAAPAERVERSKEDFIASARRAAKQAAEAKAEEAAEQAAKPTSKLGGVAAALTGGGKKKEAAAGGKRGPSRLMMVILALFAVGGGFTVVNAVMKMSRPPIERQIKVTPPDIMMERDDTNAQQPNMDREGEPDSGAPAKGGEQQDGNGERSMRSGEPIQQRMIAPDLSPQRKVAGTTGQIVGDTGAPVGIVLQNSKAVTRPEHVMRLEEQQQHAMLSARLGAALQPAPAVPAAMIPDSSVLGNTIQPVTRQTGTGVAARTVNELPPAFIGPNSLRQAAARGDASAEFEVGARFAEGKGLQQDLKQAVVWYQRAAAQGFAQAQYRLATMYERGLGVNADLARAQVWYLRAAEQGTVKAMHNLAVLSTGREGVAADYAAAAQWFAKAAAYGLVDSQFNLAVLYDGGLGVQKDMRQAYKWYALAAKAGDEEASRRLEALRGKMAAAELAQATSEIEAWRAVPIDAAANDPRVAGERWKLNVPVSSN